MASDRRIRVEIAERSASRLSVLRAQLSRKVFSPFRLLRHQAVRLVTTGNTSSVSLTCDGHFLKLISCWPPRLPRPSPSSKLAAADEVSAPRGGVVNESNVRGLALAPG